MDLLFSAEQLLLFEVEVEGKEPPPTPVLTIMTTMSAFNYTEYPRLRINGSGPPHPRGGAGAGSETPVSPQPRPQHALLSPNVMHCIGMRAQWKVQKKSRF